MFRIGQGYDVHKFKAGDFVTLCGVKVPCEFAIEAHSDGDIPLHALCDALLGALALGDIGRHFPDTDPAYRGISSLHLLRHVYQLICEQNYELVNCDLTVIAQIPKCAPHINEMQQNIAQALAVEKSQVSVKATTTETLGFVGQKQGIASNAVVLLRKRINE